LNERFSYIDSSRGIAALAVLVHHFIYFYGIYPGVSYTTGFAANFLDGSIAVTYFFVLSGFVLSIKFFNGQADIDRIDYKKFFIQRIFRIYPLFIACLLISFLCLKYYLQQELSTFLSINAYGKDVWNDQKTIGDVIKEAFLVYRFPAHSKLRLLPQDWTLTIEILMSLFIPVLVLVLKRNYTWFIFFTCLIFYFSINIFPFAVGVLLARYRYFIKSAYLSSPVLKAASMVLSLFFFTKGFLLLDTVFEGKQSAPLILKSIGSVLILSVILSSSSSQKFLANRLLTFIGKVSYGIYLTHFFILIFLVPYALNFLNTWGVTGEVVSRCFALFFLLIVTLVTSFVLHISIELPFIKAGKFLISYAEKFHFNFSTPRRYVKDFVTPQHPRI
jgi:peptidoglycan/LPS O-acetylase OafA/YrhL